MLSETTHYTSLQNAMDDHLVIGMPTSEFFRELLPLSKRFPPCPLVPDNYFNSVPTKGPEYDIFQYFVSVSVPLPLMHHVD